MKIKKRMKRQAIVVLAIMAVMLSAVMITPLFTGQNAGTTDYYCPEQDDDSQVITSLDLDSPSWLAGSYGFYVHTEDDGLTETETITIHTSPPCQPDQTNNRFLPPLNNDGDNNWLPCWKASETETAADCQNDSCRIP